MGRMAGRESEQRNFTGPSSVTERFSFRRVFARKLNKSRSTTGGEREAITTKSETKIPSKLSFLS